MGFIHDTFVMNQIIPPTETGLNAREKDLVICRSPYNALTFPKNLRWYDKQRRAYVCADGAHGVFDVKLPRNMIVQWPEIYSQVTLTKKVLKNKKLTMICVVQSIYLQNKKIGTNVSGSVAVARVELRFICYQLNK